MLCFTQVRPLSSSNWLVPPACPEASSGAVRGTIGPSSACQCKFRRRLLLDRLLVCFQHHLNCTSIPLNMFKPASTIMYHLIFKSLHSHTAHFNIIIILQISQNNLIYFNESILLGMSGLSSDSKDSIL